MFNTNNLFKFILSFIFCGFIFSGNFVFADTSVNNTVDVVSEKISDNVFVDKVYFDIDLMEKEEEGYVSLFSGSYWIPVKYIQSWKVYDALAEYQAARDKSNFILALLGFIPKVGTIISGANLIMNFSNGVGAYEAALRQALQAGKGVFIQRSRTMKIYSTPNMATYEFRYLIQ